VFEVTLIIPNGLTAFSNMPEVESSEKPTGEEGSLDLREHLGVFRMTVLTAE
jgi:hypothetical protein